MQKAYEHTERHHIHRMFIPVYHYNCFILVIATIVNILLCLIYKLSFIIGMCVEEKALYLYNIAIYFPLRIGIFNIKNIISMYESESSLLLLSRFSRVRLCVTTETAAHQAPPSLGFSRQAHWSELPFPSPMHEREK